MQTDILLSEIPDTVRPIPTSMFVNFTDGTATFVGNDRCNALRQILILVESNYRASMIHMFLHPLLHLNIVAKDGTTVSFTLSEQERVDAAIDFIPVGATRQF